MSYQELRNGQKMQCEKEQLKIAESIALMPIGRFAEPAPMLGENSATRDVVAFLEENQNYNGVVIVSGGKKPLGLVMRDQLFAHLGKRYGVSVYYDRPVRRIMTSDCIIVDQQALVIDVCQLATQREAATLYDNVIITNQGRCVGMITIKKLLTLMNCNQVNVARGQASLLTQTSERIALITDQAQAIADLSVEAHRNAEQMNGYTDEGRLALNQALHEIDTIDQTVDHQMEIMNQLLEESKEIEPISQMIRQLADQTNLLAFNASIEAARAGVHGRGFAVVAEEVRKLADETNTAARQISSLLRQVLIKIDEADRCAQEAKNRSMSTRKVADQVHNAWIQIFGAIKISGEHVNGITGLAHDIAQESEELLQAIRVLVEQAQKTAGESATTAVTSSMSSEEEGPQGAFTTVMDELATGA
ncbi:methyl-accepting chemotaxis protein [Heliophilum fasciatum]|uniref:CBS domain protein n=1 Tax=Heliophilum fasciatum TaxID=35700 RepID=A0A4R2RSI8_9FIRM|nr:methyl-accepting chemotaxis protein [Heliophilum fasciatum]MCW2278873.1 methyl-accepting chemotaxis protein [Heliophilum fasciatum]TCP62115.1 CBS domain protein [Heliophilum fasciatum]